MVKQRDELGRFVKGNTVAKGNKGNTNAKWGNQNALKHGLFAKAHRTIYEIREDGTLFVNNGITPLQIQPEGYKVINDRVHIRNDIAEQMREMGYVLISN